MKEFTADVIEELAKEYIENRPQSDESDAVYAAFCAGLLKAKEIEWHSEWLEILREDASNP